MACPQINKKCAPGGTQQEPDTARPPQEPPVSLACADRCSGSGRLSCPLPSQSRSFNDSEGLFMSVYGGLVPLGYSPFPCRRCDSLHFTIPVPAWQGDLTAGGERMYSRGEKSIRCIVSGGCCPVRAGGRIRKSGENPEHYPLLYVQEPAVRAVRRPLGNREGRTVWRRKIFPNA